MNGLLGFAFGVLLSVVIFIFTPESPVSLLKECEKLLPRSQTCVLIAVPKQETIQEK